MPGDNSENKTIETEKGKDEMVVAGKRYQSSTIFI